MSKGSCINCIKASITNEKCRSAVSVDVDYDQILVIWPMKSSVVVILVMDVFMFFNSCIFSRSLIG